MSNVFTRFLFAIGAITAMAGPANAQDGFYGKLETPPYTVERVLDGAEVRSYAPHILAQVSVRGDQRGALNRGFQVLAGYIFGGNSGLMSVDMTSPVAQSGTIAMTAPVGQTTVDDVWVVTFMMPREYSLATLPTPNSDAVRFVQVPAQRRVALTFSGRATTEALEAKTDELKAIVETQGLATSGSPIFMFYDAPMTPPWSRRNEVALDLR